MSVMQRLRTSELFDELAPQANGSVCFRVRGWFGASIYALKNDNEVHITDSALQNSRFPNNAKLYDFVRSNEHGTVHGEGNSAYAYRLDGEYIAEVIEIIHSGL